MKRGALHILLLCVFTLLAPIPLFYETIPSKEPFDPAPIQMLEREKPDWVMIGNSNLQWGVSQDLLRKLLPELRLSFFAIEASFMRYWYLEFKNIILQSKSRPKVVAIFFIDRDLTTVSYYEIPYTRKGMESVSHDREPKIEELTALNPFESLRFGLGKVYSNAEIQFDATDTIDYAALGLSRVAASDSIQFKERVSEAFSIPNLRRDLKSPPVEEPSGRQEFFSALSQSLLPELIQMAHEAHIQLVFIRLRKKPSEVTNLPPSSKSLEEYIEALSSYLTQADARFYDFTSAAELTRDLYMDGHHLTTPGKLKFTPMLAERLKEFE